MVAPIFTRLSYFSANKTLHVCNQDYLKDAIITHSDLSDKTFLWLLSDRLRLLNFPYFDALIVIWGSRQHIYQHCLVKARCSSIQTSLLRPLPRWLVSVVSMPQIPPTVQWRVVERNQIHLLKSLYFMLLYTSFQRDNIVLFPPLYLFDNFSY